MDVVLLGEMFEEAREKEMVDPGLMIQVTTLRRPELRIDPEKRALAHEFYMPLTRIFKAKNPEVSIGLFPGVPAFAVRSADGLSIALGQLLAVNFNWARVRQLLFRADAIGESAKLWIHNQEERQTHYQRAYSLATQLLGVLERENLRQTAVDGVRRGEDESYLAELEVIEEALRLREEMFLEAAQESAQSVYARGMAVGGGILLAVCVALGVAFLAAGVPAAVGIAIPAGGLGAVFSVLQRMHNDKLRLNFRAARSRLLLFGAFRPFIGAVFGSVAAWRAAGGVAPAGSGSRPPR